MNNEQRIVFGLWGAVVFSAVLGVLHFLFRSKPMGKPVVIAHRGAAGSAPENTIASVEKAIELGAALIEIDVQRTADGVLVLLHDRTINRTTEGWGRLGSLTWAEVQAASGENPVPTLREVLGVIRPSDAILALELKHPHLYPGIEAQVLALIDEYDLADRVVIISFDHDSLERVAEINPHIETGQLYIHGFWMPRVAKTNLLEVFWLMPLIEPTFVWRQHRQGRRVWIWTVDNRLLMRLLLWMGVDGITTNYPERWPK